jgi:hypothetical protein
MEGAFEPAGVGMADIVNACFVNTDMMLMLLLLDVLNEVDKV